MFDSLFRRGKRRKDSGEGGRRSHKGQKPPKTKIPQPSTGPAALSVSFEFRGNDDLYLLLPRIQIALNAAIAANTQDVYLLQAPEEYDITGRDYTRSYKASLGASVHAQALTEAGLHVVRQLRQQGWQRDQASRSTRQILYATGAAYAQARQATQGGTTISYVATSDPIQPHHVQPLRETRRNSRIPRLTAPGPSSRPALDPRFHPPSQETPGQPAPGASQRPPSRSNFRARGGSSEAHPRPSTSRQPAPAPGRSGTPMGTTNYGDVSPIELPSGVYSYDRNGMQGYGYQPMGSRATYHCRLHEGEFEYYHPSRGTWYQIG